MTEPLKTTPLDPALLDHPAYHAAYAETLEAVEEEMAARKLGAEAQMTAHNQLVSRMDVVQNHAVDMEAAMTRIERLEDKVDAMVKLQEEHVVRLATHYGYISQLEAKHGR